MRASCCCDAEQEIKDIETKISKKYLGKLSIRYYLYSLMESEQNRRENVSSLQNASMTDLSMKFFSTLGGTLHMQSIAPRRESEGER